MTLREVLKEGRKTLESSGVPEPECNAWYLFAHCFSVSKSQYFLHEQEEAKKCCCDSYRALLEQRCRRIPLEHLIGETEFMGLSFEVNENVLVPRQDTECLVEEVMKYCAGGEVLDLCTGSGCIGISLAKLGDCKSVTLSDISESALETARSNAERNEVEVQIIKSDLFQNLSGEFDFIVSNPPYIRSEEIPGLMPEVSEHEPHMALDGGQDGLVFYRKILEEAASFLKSSGRLFMEIGSEQGEAVSSLMKHAGFAEVEVKKDLAGLDRLVCGRYHI